MRRTKVNVQYNPEMPASSTQRDFFLKLSFEVDSLESDQQICEHVFAGFNHGSGNEWPVFLNANIRSLSVGDMVSVDGQWYECDHVGWKQIEQI